MDMQVWGSHIYRPFLLQNIARFSRLVVERNVYANLLEQRDFLFGSGGRDDFQMRARFAHIRNKEPIMLSTAMSSR